MTSPQKCEKAIRENRTEIRIFTYFNPSKLSEQPEVVKWPILGFNCLVLQIRVGKWFLEHSNG